MDKITLVIHSRGYVPMSLPPETSRRRREVLEVSHPQAGRKSSISLRRGLWKVIVVALMRYRYIYLVDDV